MRPIFLIAVFSFGVTVFSQSTGETNRYPLGNTETINLPEMDASVFDSNKISFVQEQSLYYAAQGVEAETYYTINEPVAMQRADRSICNLNRMVFGWHPYWQNGLESNYDWDLISDFCYFSYEVDANTGNASTTHSFATINSVDTALARGLNVHLCVTLFSGHATFLGNATSKNTLIQNLINTVTSRGADGINIDFEGVPASQATNFNNFMVALADSVHAHDPNMKVSMCLYSVDWSNIFNEPLLKDHVDFFTIMGYDYYYSGSSTAGPCDPLYGFSTGYDYSLSRSVTYYKNAGIPTDQLVLGIPYYGKEWETTSNAIPSATTGNFTYSRTFKFIKDNTSGLYNSPIFNQRSVAKTYVFQNAGTWRQSWIDEQYELEERYDLVNQRNLLGIGIWALGYDDGYTELWEAIENKLTDCEVVACTDTIYDGGGPEMNYYDNENYTYTISPDMATYLTLDFQSFATEAGYDTLFIYDGPSTSSPLVGAYTGAVSPGTVISSGPSLTLRFKSDGGTRAAGWMAVWTCTQDNVPPSTTIQDSGNWITQDENIDFTDADNMQLQYAFWNVADLNTAGHWHSNIAEGFCTDAFDELLMEWTVETGTWNLNTGTIIQTNEALTNTNMYVNVNQNNFDQYFYSWRARTGGTGTNRRSGFHFMCDNPTLPNRGNSYFVWFRPDQAQLQFYEVTTDVFTLMHTVTLTTLPNTWYDYAVIYNKLTGRIDVYVNGTQVGYWQDPTPLTVGNAVSFRTGNATLEVDHIEIFRNRLVNETLTAGSLSSMLRYENPSPVIPAGLISSVVVDDVYLLGFDSLYRDVDFTSPIYTALPTEEQIDVDTLINTTSFLEYAQVFADPNSGLNVVTYGLGTAPGLDDVIGFNSLPAGDSVSISTAGLVNGQYYYFNVYATNHAGLISDTLSSDGFLFIYNTGIENQAEKVLIYPNPTSSYMLIEVNEELRMELVDAQGKVVMTRYIPAGISWVDVQELAVGYYFLSLGDKKYKLCIAR
jgi:spore germination protein YaaH